MDDDGGGGVKNCPKFHGVIYELPLIAIFKGFDDFDDVFKRRKRRKSVNGWTTSH